MKPILPLLLILGGAGLIFRDQLAEIFSGSADAPAPPASGTPAPAKPPLQQAPPTSPAAPPIEAIFKPYPTPYTPPVYSIQPYPPPPIAVTPLPTVAPWPIDVGPGMNLFDIVEMALERAGYRGQDMTADQWSYYVQESTGQPVGVELFTPGNREERIPFREYERRWKAAGSPGLMNLKALSGARRLQALPGSGLRKWRS